MMTESANNHDRTGEELVTVGGSTISGRTLILGILSVALLMAGFAWIHQKQKGHRTLEFWGSRIAQNLRYGNDIELMRLTPPNNSVEQNISALIIDGQSWGIVNQCSIEETPGLVHARQALVFDPSYDFEATPHQSPVWEYALRLGDSKSSPMARPGTNDMVSSEMGDEDIVLLFDLQNSVARSRDSQDTVTITIASGLKKFFTEIVD